MSTFDQQSAALIEEHVRRLLQSMGFTSATVACREQIVKTEQAEQTQLHIFIEAGEDGKLLIGIQGSHLEALQHLIRCLLRHQLPAPVYISVDVNGYRERHERSLLQLANSTAERAKQTGRTVVMRPMTAADRRLLHTALAERGDVQTESIGDEPNRRVVIRPVFL